MVRRVGAARCCKVATAWPEACVGDWLNRIGMDTMAMPVAADKLGHSRDSDEAKTLAALLPIGPDQKARIRILVVDDEYTLRESCGTVLRQEGYDVTLSGRGPEALDLLKRRAFDIVLADLYMAQVDGLALLRAAQTTNRDTVVIVMTGNPSVDSSVEALRQGAFDYLPKPFSATHLQVLIGRAVTDHRIWRDLPGASRRAPGPRDRVVRRRCPRSWSRTTQSCCAISRPRRSSASGSSCWSRRRRPRRASCASSTSRRSPCSTSSRAGSGWPSRSRSSARRPP